MNYNLYTPSFYSTTYFDDTLLKSIINKDDQNLLKTQIFEKKIGYYKLPHTIDKSTKDIQFDTKKLFTFYQIIEKYFIQNFYPEKTLSKCFYSDYKYGYISMGGFQFFKKGNQGKAYSEVLKHDGNLPEDCIIPADAGRQRMLLLPSKLAIKHGIDFISGERSMEEWLVGTIGSDVDTIFLFAQDQSNNTGKNEIPTIRCLSPALYPEVSEYLVNLNISNLRIWKEKAYLYFKNSRQVYFHIPESLLQVVPGDTYYYKEDSVEWPAFYGFYDGLGNFIYSRICYGFDKQEHSRSFYPAIFSQTVPSEIPVSEILEKTDTQ